MSKKHQNSTSALLCGDSHSLAKIELKQLDYFIHVADLGSFTRASEQLGVAQSALSRHVRQLEVELRQNLLRRDGRGVILTEAGKRFAAHGRGILLQVQRAAEDMAEMRGAPVGHVMVGFPHSLGRILTVAFVMRFKQDFPAATLSITEGLTSHLNEWLTTGRLDLALLHDPTPSSVIETLPLLRDELFLLSAANSLPARQAVSLEQLAALPLILPRRPHPLRMMIETCLANEGKRPQVSLEIDAVPAIADLVAEGVGFGVVTKNAIRVAGQQASRFRFDRIVAPGLRSTLVLARPAERPSTALIQRVHDLLSDFVPQCLKRANP